MMCGRNTSVTHQFYSVVSPEAEGIQIMKLCDTAILVQDLQNKKGSYFHQSDFSYQRTVRSAMATNACSVTRSLKLCNVEPG